ncbi:DEAD/DEAH box helicase domain protein [Emticicia oligotrophica DSM 17448]|uniref:RNA helicase n=1 Tax=Emticicia oligotrophica (strain DSM 17448 / CIP 109782 / MTCC 6937 / GPTSA100-15) TaxID=929562 RepID=A0ABN4APD0_EMTOG|nr:DEAD/DEAH box helicase [Emticicia oligotrophica]AFK04219.1 DEAD/DEAH box helicase domain protein [Emticicia oligotrophica DSM 17448]
MEQVKFSDLPVSEYILRAVEEMGFEFSTPIQSQGIPAVLRGGDVIGQAQTGTGKTAAFGIPAIEAVDVEDKNTQVLVMCPTRELALQVKEQIQKLAKYKKGLHVAAIYGGESYERQFLALKKGVQIVVGTPGRIMDHIDRKTLSLSSIKMAILDEADEMLNMGFREDIEKILSYAPDERQTVLFSATMSPEILSIAKRFQKDPEVIRTVKTEISNANIEQFFFPVRREAKMEVMTRLIDVNNLKLMLVFANTKSKVDEIVSELQIRGYAAEGLHGDMRQQVRTQVMNKFRAGTTTILVATDVAARGIDVSGVDAVFNYDVPQDLEYYVHRIGRTGRAGKTGKAFMFISGREKSRLREIEYYTKVKIEQGQIPTLAELIKTRHQKFVEQVRETLTAGIEENYEDIINELSNEGYSDVQIMSALIKMQVGTIKSEFSDNQLSDSYRESRSNDRFGSRDSRSTSGRRDSRDGGRDFGQSRERRFEPRERRREGGPSRGSANGDMVRLFLSLGRKDNVAPNHIVGAITSETRIAGRAIGQIDIYDKFSFVEVPQADVKRVLEGMQGKTINARQVSMEIAK